MKQTLLHLTVQKGLLPQVEQQLRDPATITRHLNEQDSAGNTPLHLAVKLRHLSIVKAKIVTMKLRST
jgi:hypothetical protein